MEWHAILLATLFARWAAVEIKYLIVGMLLLILISLGKALFHLSSNKPGDSEKMVKALTWRIGLSVTLFVILLVAYRQHWIQPPH